MCGRSKVLTTNGLQKKLRAGSLILEFGTIVNFFALLLDDDLGDFLIDPVVFFGFVLLLVGVIVRGDS